MIVMKFGGTSVGSASMIKETIAIARNETRRKPIVVVSAVSKITDQLLRAAKEAESGSHNRTLNEIREKHQKIMEELGISRELLEPEFSGLENALKELAVHGKPTQKELDNIAAFGEIMAAKIVAEYGRKQGMKTKAYCAFDIGLLTNDNFGAAEILKETFANIAGRIRAMPEGEIPVVTGFIGKTRKGEMTTLGRGGSDYSAAIIGAAINAEEVQIWTDVDGMMTADPKVVPNAHTIAELSFDEASELAYFGAKVLHPKTILPVMEKGIPVRVLNTYNPSAKGTRIVRALSDDNDSITAIACKKGVSVINMHTTRMFGAYGFLHKIFKMFDEHQVSVDMVSTSEVNVSVTIDNRENGDVTGLLRELGTIADVNVENSKACICVVGRVMKKTPAIAAEAFSTLGENGVNIEMISQGASEINIGMVVNEAEADNAVRLLHSTFFAS